MGRLVEHKEVENGRGIMQLRPWHRAMARYVAAGVRPTELAEMFGYTCVQVSRILQSPLFEAEVHRLQTQAEYDTGDVERDLKRLSLRAVEILDREMEGDDGEKLGFARRRLQTNVAFGVLDRAGHSKKDQPVHLHKHEHVHVERMSDEELYRDVVELTEEGE